MGVKPTEALVGRFSDGEIQVQIKENIRGTDVFIVQSTGAPAENLLELLLLIDAAKRASARRITAVIPYYGYARQDRKSEPRVPISAKLVANLLETAGASRVLTVDLHADQIQGFFDIPVDNLYAIPVFMPALRDMVSDGEWVIVSPDVGSTKRAHLFARHLGDLPMVLVDKRRERPNAVESVRVVGEVKGKRCLVVDDIIDTGGTIRKAAEALLERGAKDVVVVATHGVFSGNAKEKLNFEGISRIFVTNTVPPKPESLPPKTQVLDVAPLLAEAILRIHEERSISELFYGGMETWFTSSLWLQKEKR